MNDYTFHDSFSVDDIYYNHSRFHQIFYEFCSKINSLHRYFVFSEKFVDDYIRNSENSLNNIPPDLSIGAEVDGVYVEFGAAEYQGAHSEITYSDKEYFPETLYGSQLANIFSLFENLLWGIAKEIASETGSDIESFRSSSEKKMPYIDKYLLFLSEECGIDIKLDKDTKKSLSALRFMRNRYIHQVTKMISDDLRRDLEKLLGDTAQVETLNREYVKEAFNLITKIAHDLENKYWGVVGVED